jgi:glutamate/tyrosine decarboxylase-like PLP-dependent enzyme
MERDAFLAALDEGMAALARWEAHWPSFTPDPTTQVPPAQIRAVLAELAERLHDNYPFFHPQYAGQMLKPPHPIAQLAYLLAMRINPNNHALDGGPATAALEREAVAALAQMFGYPPTFLGHLTSSGTIANLEALWVAREMRPGRAIAYSSQAHYVHARACDILGVQGVKVPCDSAGRLDLAALERHLAEDAVGVVVATIGTTGLGALDPLPEILALARRHGAWVHADAAYGGFFALLAQQEPSPVPAGPLRALADCDSIVVDPHKHGLQPYGCGAVLFRDPAVARVYRHDSPATYFTAADLHLGEISLECSRAGAAAAALWATLRCFPLQPDAGLGPILARTRAAALAWAARLQGSDRFRLVVGPELDIVTFYPRVTPARASVISKATEVLFQALMTDPAHPIYLAKLAVDRELLAASDPTIVWDQPRVTVLRSVLMKPEHLALVETLHETVERKARAVLAEPASDAALA